MNFAPGTKVIRKADGGKGTVVSNDGAEIVIAYEATGATKNSPWGEYIDSGSEGHVRVQFADRLIREA